MRFLFLFLFYFSYCEVKLDQDGTDRYFQVLMYSFRMNKFPLFRRRAETTRQLWNLRRYLGLQYSNLRF